MRESHLKLTISTKKQKGLGMVWGGGQILSLTVHRGRAILKRGVGEGGVYPFSATASSRWPRGRFGRGPEAGLTGMGL